MAPKGPPYYSIYTVPCKSNETRFPKSANLAEQIANFRFGRKSGDVSVASVVRISKVMNRNEISWLETKFRIDISCLQDEISFRQGLSKIRSCSQNTLTQLQSSPHCVRPRWITPSSICRIRASYPT